MPPSSQAPMWFCHECNAEMRPLMVPDPHCASCNGTFVEMIEDTQDDPRAYSRPAGPGMFFDAQSQGSPGEYPEAPSDFFQRLMESVGGPARRSSLRFDRRGDPTAPSTIPADPFERLRSRSGNQPPTSPGPFAPTSPGPFSMGNTSTSPAPSSPRPDNRSTGSSGGMTSRTFTGPGGMSFTFMSGGSGFGRDGDGPSYGSSPYEESTPGSQPTSPGAWEREMPPGGTSHPLVGLFAALSGASGPQNPSQRSSQDDLGANPILRHLLNGMFQPAGGGHGNFGDYVFSAEGLDQVISNLMAQADGGKPVPAPDDMIEKLPRSVVEEGAGLQSQDCAVCKDSFEPSQLTVQLPCKHNFHEECILPWVKQSGTCPVCRYELVPQPHKDEGGAGSGAGGAGQSGEPSRPAPDRQRSSSFPGRRGPSLPGAWDHDLD